MTGQLVLLDSNVIVDYALKRPGFVENAKKIFQQTEDGTIVGCMSSSAVTDVYYIVESKTTHDYAWTLMEYLYQTLRIVPVIRKPSGERWIPACTTSRTPFKPPQRGISALTSL